MLTTIYFVVQYFQRIATLISYRGNEAVDCVGMQPIVELDIGLCDYLNPDRFFKKN